MSFLIGETAAEAQATDGDVVVLTSGKKLEGKITRVDPTRYIVIELSDGREPIVSWKHIKTYRRGGRWHEMSETAALGDGKRETEGEGAIDSKGARFRAGFKLDAAEERRQAWLLRGGSLASYELRLSAFGRATTTVRSAPRHDRSSGSRSWDRASPKRAPTGPTPPTSLTGGSPGNE